jgi:hypothetical protein
MSNEVLIQSGANSQSISLGENEVLTVGEVRNRLGDVLNIAPTSLAVIGDEAVDDDSPLVGGQTLQFIKQSGSKG